MHSKRIIAHTGCTTIPITESERDFCFGDTVILSKGMVEIMLQTLATFYDIPVLPNVVDVNIRTLLGLDALDGNNLLIDNVTGHLWNRVIMSKQPLRYDDMREVKLIRKVHHLYVPLKAPLQFFYTTAQLRKLHTQFAHPSAIRLYDLLKTSRMKAATPKTLEKFEYIVSACEPCLKTRAAPTRYLVTI